MAILSSSALRREWALFVFRCAWVQRRGKQGVPHPLRHSCVPARDSQLLPSPSGTQVPVLPLPSLVFCRSFTHAEMPCSALRNVPHHVAVEASSFYSDYFRRWLGKLHVCRTRCIAIRATPPNACHCKDLQSRLTLCRRGCFPAGDVRADHHGGASHWHQRQLQLEAVRSRRPKGELISRSSR